MSKKYYLIQFSENKRPPIVLKDWAECQKILKDSQNRTRVSSFKSQSDVKEHLDYLKKASNLSQYLTVHLYVDGSFFSDFSYAGWAWIAVNSENQIIRKDYGITSNPALSHNIDGELTAVMQGLDWWSHHSKNNNCFLLINHDYQGIESWVTGEWKAKTPLSLEYTQKLMPHFRDKKIFFKKVTAHSGNYWNEQVDQLAKKAIEENK